MKAMTYLVWANIKGLIRNIKKKKGQLVLWIFLIGMFAMMLFANNKVGRFPAVDTRRIPDFRIRRPYPACHRPYGKQRHKAGQLLIPQGGHSVCLSFAGVAQAYFDIRAF